MRAIVPAVPIAVGSASAPLPPPVVAPADLPRPSIPAVLLHRDEVASTDREALHDRRRPSRTSAPGESDAGTAGR